MANIITDTTLIYNGHKPYDDDQMIWDSESRQYKLNPNRIDDTVGLDISSKFKLNLAMMIDEASADVYNTIYEYNQGSEQKFRATQYFLGYSPEARAALKKAMIACVRSTRWANYMLTKYMDPVNLSTGIILDIESVSIISKASMMALKRVKYLLYRGTYGFYVDDNVYGKEY